MSQSADVLWSIEQRLTELYEEERKLKAARAALVRPAPAVRPRTVRIRVRAPQPTVTRLPPVQRPTLAHTRPAAIDDVLALVVAGHNEAVGIAAILKVRIPSVTKRLRELRGQGMVKLGENGWEATFKARHLNWVPHRVRELLGEVA